MSNNAFDPSRPFEYCLLINYSVFSSCTLRDAACKLHIFSLLKVRIKLYDIPPPLPIGYLYISILFPRHFCYISLLFPLLFIYLMFNSYYSPSPPVPPPPLFRQAFQNVSRILLYIHSP